MAAKNGDYVNIEGFVQFDPTERDAGAQKVLNVPIRSKSNDLISLTFWPGLKEQVTAEVGDYIVARGKYSERTVQKQDGTQQTYKGVSVVQAAITPGLKEAAVKSSAADAWA